MSAITVIHVARNHGKLIALKRPMRDDLDELQKLVGGSIERVAQLGNYGLELWGDEDGRTLGLEMTELTIAGFFETRIIIAGDFFITGPAMSTLTPTLRSSRALRAKLIERFIRDATWSDGKTTQNFKMPAWSQL